MTEKTTPQPVPPVQVQIPKDPAYSDATLRAERDGLASISSRLQLQLNEALEMNHALKQEIARLRAVIDKLQARDVKKAQETGEAPEPANRAARRRAAREQKRADPGKGNGAAAVAKPPEP
jgi:regulator of replication initiation timing